MSTKDDLSSQVPTLVGPNWIIWEAQMKAYLRTKGLWQLVTGNEQRPVSWPPGRHAVTARVGTDTTPAREAVAAVHFPTNEEITLRFKEQADWDNKDDQALGIITLKISHSLRTHIGDERQEALGAICPPLSRLQAPPQFLTISLKSSTCAFTPQGIQPPT